LGYDQNPLPCCESQRSKLELKLRIVLPEKGRKDEP
jgi:hypothetical protein